MNLKALRDYGEKMKVDFSPEALWGIYDFQYENHLPRKTKRQIPKEKFIFDKLIEYLEVATAHYGNGGGGRWNGKHIYK